MSTFPSDPELDAICGSIIREWAYLEHTLTHYYLGFLQSPDQFRARIAWASISNFQGKRKTLNRLAENFLEADELRCFRILMKRTSRLGGKRNRIAHAMCVREGNFVCFTNFDQEGDDGTFLFVEQEFEPISNVKAWAPAIAKLTEDFLRQHLRLMTGQLASAKMHREPRDGRAPNNGPHPAESTPEEPSRQP